MKKIAIVTGASRGIGRVVAKRLARDSFAVVVNYLSNSSEAEEVVAEIKARGERQLRSKQMSPTRLTLNGSSRKP